MPASTALAAGSILVPPLPPDLLPPVSANNAARIRAEVEDADVGSGIIGLVPDGADAFAADLIDGATATAAAADSVQDDASEPPGILVSKYFVHSRFLLVWWGVPAPPGTSRPGRSMVFLAVVVVVCDR